MIKVPDIVMDIVRTDELALESLRGGLLNLSAYADKIHQRIENATKKEVKRGTIVVALSRLSKNLPDIPPLNPEVKIINLSFKSALASLTFPKTIDVQRKISVLNPFQISVNELIAVIEGISEVTLIVSQESKAKILKHFATKPKSEHDDLVAITVQLPKALTSTPNVYFTLLNSLASKRISITQIITTDTEVTFITKHDNLEETIKALNVYFQKQVS